MIVMGDKIKTLREHCHLTQAELAARLDLQKTSISGYETGLALPPLETLLRLADVLHTSIYYFLDRNAPRVIVVSGLTEGQEAAVRKVVDEFMKLNNK